MLVGVTTKYLTVQVNDTCGNLTFYGGHVCSEEHDLYIYLTLYFSHKRNDCRKRICLYDNAFCQQCNVLFLMPPFVFQWRFPLYPFAYLYYRYTELYRVYCSKELTQVRTDNDTAVSFRSNILKFDEDLL